MMMRHIKFPSAAARRDIGSEIGTFAIIAAVSALAAGLYCLDWNAKSAGFLSDDAVYLLMSDAFSPFQQADPELSSYVLRQSLFPPLYPLLLALLGAGSNSLLWAHIITTSTLLLALAAFGLWIFSETRDRFATLALVMIFAVLPGTLLISLELLSEFPYLLWSLVAVWLASRTSETGRGYLLVGLCAGLAAITRSAGLSLVIAMAIWLFVQRTQRHVKWTMLLVAIVPSLVWAAYKTLFVGSKGGYGQFWGWLLEQFRNNQLSEYVPRFLKTQSEGFWQGLLADLDLRPSTMTEVALGIVLLAALPVWIRRLKTWRLDALYLLIGGAMIFFYPFPNFFARLLLPWLPIILFYFYLGVRSLGGRWGLVRDKPVLAYGALAALFLTLLPSLGFVGHRLAEPIEPQLATWKHTRYWFRFDTRAKIRSDLAFRENFIVASRDIQQLVPKGDCVFSVYTAVAMLYGKRIFEQPPPPSDSQPVFAQRNLACKYFFLISASGTIGSESVPPFYPTERLSADSVEVVHVWKDDLDPNHPTAMLLRTKPSS